jgi:hypothetical protein
VTARLVLVCDVCGAITDDHYPYPVARARRLARAVGFHYRRISTTPGNYRGAHASYHRLYVDLCAEHTYELGLNRSPIQRVGNWRNRGAPAEPMQPMEPEPQKRFTDATVVYEEGAGPYRLYRLLVEALRPLGITRSQLERLRREMFAAGADCVEVGNRWALVKTEDTDESEEDRPRGGGAG